MYHKASSHERTRLVEAVAKLAVAIDKGERTPAPGELEALAVVCDQPRLPAEVARVRGWMRGAA
jgi:hypothetical protein